MHGKKGGKSPRGFKKSPKNKRMLTRLSASNSTEERPPVVQESGTSEEDINAYLDPTGSDTNTEKDMDIPPPDDAWDRSSDDEPMNEAATGSILRKALESPRNAGPLRSEHSVVVNPPRGNVIMASPNKSNPPPVKSPGIPTGVIKKSFPFENACGSSSVQPLSLEELNDEESDVIGDMADIPPPLVSPGQTPRISPKRKQSPAAEDSNIEDGDRTPPTPSKIAKVSFNAFATTDSPCSEGEYIVVEDVPINESNDVNMETRNVTFMKPAASRTSSADTDETTRPAMEQYSEPPTSHQNSKVYIRAVYEDRFAHMSMNVAEKFRLIPDIQQQFLAESLQHMILAEALAGRLTRNHIITASKCVHCAKGMKEE